MMFMNWGSKEHYQLFRFFISIAVSRDHKPYQTERQRIVEAAGFVRWAGTWCVAGVRAVSRVFGDKLTKQYVRKLLPWSSQ
nr:probable protein phosphatase 2C 45 isoform X3 [Aegilops tauschii subsp. strangulata]